MIEASLAAALQQPDAPAAETNLSPQRAGRSLALPQGISIDLAAGKSKSAVVSSAKPGVIQRPIGAAGTRSTTPQAALRTVSCASPGHQTRNMRVVWGGC